jgi:large subunit ribosomal protein L6
MARRSLWQGKLGELSRSYPEEILLVQEGDEIKVTKAVETRKARQLHGLCRTLTSNMLEGVSTGWSKKLILIGVGYRAAVAGNQLTLNLGYSNPVVMELPPSITATVSVPSSSPLHRMGPSIRSPRS